MDIWKEDENITEVKMACHDSRLHVGGERQSEAFNGKELGMYHLQKTDKLS